jgi:hypothetical protein
MKTMVHTHNLGFDYTSLTILEKKISQQGHFALMTKDAQKQPCE